MATFTRTRKKARPLRRAGLVLMTLLVTLAGFVAPAHAAGPLIDRVVLLDDGGRPIDTISRDQRVKVQIEWTEKEPVQVGDAYRVSLPEQLRVTDFTFPLKDDAGNVVGSGEVVDRVVVFAFNEAATQKTNLRGQIIVEGQFHYPFSKTDRSDALTFDVGGVTDTKAITVLKDEPLDEHLYKWASTQVLNGNEIAWSVRVNQNKDALEGAKVVDTVKPGHELMASTITVGTIDTDEYGFSKDGVKPVPEDDYKLTTSDDGFTLELGDVTKTYFVTYRTKATVIQYEYQNDATLSADGFVPVDVYNKYRNFDGGGISIGDEPTGTLHLLKQDEEANPLPGATFHVTDASGATHDVTTGEDGGVTLENLPIGKATVVETQAPEGHVRDDSPHEVTIARDKTVRLDVTNRIIRGTVTVLKVDAETGDPIPETEFLVLDGEGAEVAEGVTDAEGRWSVELPYGRYEVLETKAAPGYDAIDTRFYADVRDDGQEIELEVVNDYIYGTLDVLKTDEETGEPLPGATFDLLTQDGEVFDTLTTGEDGHARTSLPHGTYDLVETGAPEGYVVSEEVIPVQIDSQGQTVEKVIENRKVTGILRLLKRDAETGEALPGATFIVRDEDGADVGRLESDPEGIVLIDLPYGAYTVTEIEAPEGYLLDGTVHRFAIETDEQVVELELDNRPEPAPEPAPTERTVDKVTREVTERVTERVTEKSVEKDRLVEKVIEKDRIVESGGERGTLTPEPVKEDDPMPATLPDVLPKTGEEWVRLAQQGGLALAGIGLLFLLWPRKRKLFRR